MPGPWPFPENQRKLAQTHTHSCVSAATANHPPHPRTGQHTRRRQMCGFTQPQDLCSRKDSLTLMMASGRVDPRVSGRRGKCEVSCFIVCVCVCVTWCCICVSTKLFNILKHLLIHSVCVDPCRSRFSSVGPWNICQAPGLGCFIFNTLYFYYCVYDGAVL